MGTLAKESLWDSLASYSDVKSTDYFRNVVPRKHPEVQLEWVQRVLANPVKRSTQADGRLVYWGNIAEQDGRALRVVTLEDGETVANEGEKNLNEANLLP
ncbi:MAG: hypothetical protein ACOYM4_19040 [Nodosilinea sp.]